MTYVGLDVHKHSVSCCYYISDDDYHFKSFKLPQESDELYNSLTAFDEVAVEACAPAIPIQKHLKTIVKSITCVAPSLFPDIAKSYKKTDKHDSFCLAKGLKNNILPKAHQKSDASLQILSMINMRRQFTLYLRSLKSLMGSIALRNAVYINKNMLTSKRWRLYLLDHDLPPGERITLELAHEEITRLTIEKRHLDITIDQYGQQFSGYSLLKQLPGFAAYTAAIIIAEIDDIKRFPAAKNLCSYFGLVPRVRQSAATDINRRITKRGDKESRAAIVWATYFFIRESDYFGTMYNRLRRKKAGKVALIAVSRKVLCLIYYILKKNIIIDNFSALMKEDFHKLMS